MLVHITVFTQLKYLSADLGLDTSDVAYLVRRLHNEGLTFVTSTLPRLWKCVSWSFQVGFFDRSNEAFSLTSFAWKGRSLRNFRSLLDNIFDRKSGILLPKPEATAVFKLRMLCEYLYKLVIPFTQDKLALAQGSYKALEKDYSPNKRNASMLLQLEEMRWAIARFYPEITRASVEDILRSYRPRYGPGSMNLDSLSNHARLSCFTYWEYKHLPRELTGLAPKRLEAVSGFFKPYPGMRLRPQDRKHDKKLSVKRECQVMFVPKNADGPRVITRENPFDIRLQMAYQDWSASLFQRVTFGRVQFTDQAVNRDLARIGSLDGSIACADLKEASDRVSFVNASQVFRDCPGVSWFFRNTRATHARLPDGESVFLKKLAGMGSGLTFPTMAMYIFLASVVGIIRGKYSGAKHIKNVPNIERLWKQISKDVFVFGDDLVVKSEYANHAFIGLEHAGLSINYKKTHTKGPFRESCGGDFLLGEDVTPIRLKLMNGRVNVLAQNGSYMLCMTSREDAYLLERHCRELVRKGFVTLSEYYYRILEKVYGKLPYVSHSSPYLGRYVVGGIPPSKDTKAWYPSARKESFELMDPYTALGRCLRPSSGELYSSDPVTMYGEIAVPRAVKLKKRLVSAANLNGIEQAPILLRSSKSWNSVERWIINNNALSESVRVICESVPSFHGIAFGLLFSQLDN